MSPLNEHTARMKMFIYLFLFSLNIIFFLIEFCPSESTEDTYMFPRRQNNLRSSNSSPQCEKMDLKIIQSLLQRVQIHKNAGKPKNLWELNDFSEEQQAV